MNWTEPLDRRAFAAGLARLGVGGVAAAMLARWPAASAIVPEDDPRVAASYVVEEESGRAVRGYLAQQKEGGGLAPGVVVIHEERGLGAHARDVTRRIALEGFVAFAPDLMPPLGGTPADGGAREAAAKSGLDHAVQDAIGAARWLARERRTTGAVGMIGFGWGGAVVNRAAAAGPALRAGVAYYGPAPEPEQAAMVSAPLLLHFGGLDGRVNRSGEQWVKALQKAGKTVNAYYYPGAHHAFGDDSSAGSYDPEAARLAWDRTVEFLRARLE